jgi:hypothetical protein
MNVQVSNSGTASLLNALAAASQSLRGWAPMAEEEAHRVPDSLKAVNPITLQSHTINLQSHKDLIVFADRVNTLTETCAGVALPKDIHLARTESAVFFYA